MDQGQTFVTTARSYHPCVQFQLLVLYRHIYALLNILTIDQKDLIAGTQAHRHIRRVGREFNKKKVMFIITVGWDMERIYGSWFDMDIGLGSYPFAIQGWLMTSDMVILRSGSTANIFSKRSFKSASRPL